MSPALNWPDGIERTPPGERTNTSKFQSGFQKTRTELAKEMDRMGVDRWHLDHVVGSDNQPGIVLRWEKQGAEYAVACEAYAHKKDNLRDLYLWVHETRMREQRPTETAQDSFAAARLPPTEEEAIELGGATSEPPHEVLGVAPDAEPEAVRAAARALQKKFHADGSNPDQERYVAVTKAKEAMLDG